MATNNGSGDVERDECDERDEYGERDEYEEEFDEQDQKVMTVCMRANGIVCGIDTPAGPAINLIREMIMSSESTLDDDHRKGIIASLASVQGAFMADRDLSQNKSAVIALARDFAARWSIAKYLDDLLLKLRR